jgi:hypothetical protein
LQYDITIVRPFQEINRYLDTERPCKDAPKERERSVSKLIGVKLKTDYEEIKMRNESGDSKREKGMENIGRKVRVGVKEMRFLML